MTDVAHVQALDELAATLGVTRSYYDGIGQHRRACDEAVLAVVRALGAPVDRAGDVSEALRAVRAGREADRLPAVVVVTEGEGATVELPGVQAAAAQVRLVLESGSTIHPHLTPLVTPPVAQEAPFGVRVRVSSRTAAGYHRLDVEEGGRLRHVHVLVAPRSLPRAARGWGLFAPLYALRKGPSLATYADLAWLGRWMGETARPGHDRHAAYLGTLPLLACFFEEPFEPSPYSPISRAFWSEIYIDPAAAAEVGAGALPAISLPCAGATGGLLDYRRAMRERRAAIEALLRNLDERGGRRREDFENALENDAELARYAAFRACVERQGTTWQAWPARAQAGTLRPGADYDGEVFRYHAYAQWLAREQVATAAEASPAGLYLDLPLGAHGGGYDTWRYADDFAAAVSAGAPPDAVFEGGQDWGFPPLHPERARESCYASVRSALRHHFAHAALLRVDHVMGLHRLFWIPEGFSAADGVYVRSHADELWAILAIEAARARGGAGAAVVGEDLGTVPDEVRAEMNARGALRMHVVPFECREDPAAPIARPPADSLACLGTHDMEPFASWWRQPSTRRDGIAAFVAVDDDSSEPGAALPALLAWLARSEAAVVCANLEDFWLEPERQNLPGTAAADRNWKRPFARDTADFASDPAVRRLVRITSGADPAAPAPATVGEHVG